MLSAANSPLVAGSGVENPMAKMQHVRVLRAFNHECEPQPKGKVLELPLSFAIELRSANKVEFIDEPKPEATKVDAKEPPKAKSESKAAEPSKGAK